VALRALQGLRNWTVFESLLARRTNQNFQQIFGNHAEHFTPSQEAATASLKIYSTSAARGAHAGVRFFQKKLKV
jgi:hypothetical protein